ncbi:merozoite surface protein-3, putative [Perkinsus marinus ATCC 50983]|uniref:Merozoite surface protein-3, putative n=1 Tax=Perkinsus marinus (strain ATCC 50983 / TXsc) TaxID=423536 RepID=C5L700_PERM5|nr:merozoite surface protein-3, putative [Perkinsus marinus ATCC 50983]EER07262.1 merozoite surface protein-3, putative [Perkinsus marinus ATCC 50983]|eukprot:XP_002775446.1 merozoite surface protein-3, putative [Perkinsus marinus ATCC 50983]
MFNVEAAVYASSTAARNMAMKHAAYSIQGPTEKSIRELDDGKCQVARMASRSAGIEIRYTDEKFRMPLPPPPLAPPVDPTERMWTATKEKVAAKETIETDLMLDRYGPGLPADRMFHGDLKQHFTDLSALCKDELNRLLKYTVYSTALNNLGDNPEVEQAVVKSIRAALASMLGRLEDYSKVIIDRAFDTLPPAGTNLETEVFKSRLLSVQLDTCVRSHETLQGKLEDALWRLTNQALSFRHLRMSYQRDMHLMRSKLKGLVIEVEDHLRFRESSSTSAQRLLKSTREVEDLISKVSKSDTDVNIFVGDIYMEEEIRQQLRQKEEEMKALFGVERGRFEMKVKTLLLENRTYRTRVEELSDKNDILNMKIKHLETQIEQLGGGQGGGNAGGLTRGVISLQGMLGDFKDNGNAASVNPAAAPETLVESMGTQDEELVAVSRSELNNVQAAFQKLKRQSRLYADLVAQSKTRLMQGIALVEKNSKALIPASSEIDMEDEACATATGVKPKPMSFTKADELKQEVSVLQRRLAEQGKTQDEAVTGRDEAAARLVKVEAELEARTEQLNMLKYQMKEKEQSRAEAEQKKKKAEAAAEKARAEEIHEQERSRYAIDSARRKTMLAERDRRISYQENEIQRLHDKMGSQEQRLGELKSERKELANSLKHTRTQLRQANEQAKPKMKVMGREKALMRAHTSAVDEPASGVRHPVGQQIELLRNMCSLLGLPEIVDEVQSATSYNARLKRERGIVWRSQIRTHSIHGARELEEVMDKNLAESRFNRTRTGRLRKMPRNDGRMRSNLQTMSEPSSSEGEEEEEKDVFFNRADFGSKYGRLTDYVQARAVTWQTTMRAQGDAHERIESRQHAVKRMDSMEVQFLKEQQKSLEVKMEGMRFDIELKDYELRKIREAWINANDSRLIYKNAYDLELRSRAGGRGLQGTDEEQEQAAKKAVVEAMQADEEFSLIVAERAVMARKRMIELSDEVEKEATQLANKRHSIRKIGKALKTEDDYGWADFDFAATLEEDQAVIAGIDAALAAATGSEIGDDDDNKRWHEELKAEVLTVLEQDRVAKYGEKIGRLAFTASSSSSSSSVSSSDSSSDEEEDPYDRAMAHTSKRDAPLVTDAAVRRVTKLMRGLKSGPKHAFWEDAGAREQQRKSVDEGKRRGSGDQRRDSKMLMEFERLQQEALRG